LSDVANHERNIADNLSFRSKKNDLTALEGEIGQLERDLEKYENHSYTSQLRDLKESQDRLVIESSVLEGERSQLLVNLKSIKSELEGEFANSYREFKDAQIKVKTTELAISDLEKYAKALDMYVF
jgi:DNA repair protein RAD50